MFNFCACTYIKQISSHLKQGPRALPYAPPVNRCLLTGSVNICSRTKRSKHLIQLADIMQQSAVHLAYAVNTTTVSWIGKSSVKEVMSLVMRKCVDGTKPGDFARIEHELQVNPLLTQYSVQEEYASRYSCKLKHKQEYNLKHKQELQGKKAYCFVVSRHSGIAATVRDIADI